MADGSLERPDVKSPPSSEEPALDREAIGRLMADMRPRLHRYCARMVGSAIEGEDVVQETLAKASEALVTAGPIERPESWLLRIAHNTALDALRRRRRRVGAETGRDPDLVADSTAAADSRVVAAAGLAPLLRLPVMQRASLVLADVLGHSLAETAEILGASLAAVKAALHRARGRMQAIRGDSGPAPALDATERERLQAYADRFNARDFDALRRLLADDVRLDLANRIRLAGAKDVSVYFTRYDATSDWRFAVGWADGRPALLVSDPADPSAAARYVVLLDWEAGRIKRIRDYRFAPYVTEGLALRTI